jgi:hypothetical protein
MGEHRTRIVLFGLQVTIFGGILGLTATSSAIILAVAALGLAISGYAFFSRGTADRR